MRYKLGTAVLLAVALALVSASAASAELGITSYFRFPTDGDPGTVTGASLGRVGVNHSGAGGVFPGDLYAGGSRFSAAGDFEGPAGSGSVNQATGEVYGGGEFGGKISVYSATGGFLRSFGYDTVSTGPDDSSVDEQQQLTIDATGGTYTLSCCVLNGSSLTTVPLAFNATAQEVEDALNALAAVGPAGGNVTVSGGPSGPGDPGPGPFVYTIDFGGTLAGDDFTQWDINTIHLTGNTVTGRVATLVNGGGVETCVPASGDVCHTQGWTGNDSNSRPTQGSFNNVNALGLAPSAAPNGGNFLVADAGYQRVSEFTPGGAFVRAFGWDVVSHGPNDGNADEQQKLTVDATGGKFSLSFPDFTGECCGTFVKGPTTGAFGSGEITSGSNTIANVDTTNGAFAIGQSITSTGAGIPAGTTITGVNPGAHTLTLSANATTGAGAPRDLTANDIPYNATAAQVKAALESLPSIGGVGGTVNVTGPNGGPYTIAFGGTLGGDELVALGSSTAALTGGTKTATVATFANGGAFETCVAAAGDVCKTGVPGKAGVGGSKLGQFRNMSGIAEDSSGAIYVADGPQSGNGDNSNFRVQKFTPNGSGFTPTVCCSPEEQSVTVSAGAGQFRLTYFEPDGTIGAGTIVQGSTVITGVTTTTGGFVAGQPIRTANANTIPAGTTIASCTPSCAAPTSLTLSQPASSPEPAPNKLISTRAWQTGDIEHDASAQQVEDALNALAPLVSGGGVNVSGGIGDPAGSSPYLVSFDGPALNGFDHPQLLGADGTTPLGGGTGAGANQALVAPVQDGQPSGSVASESPGDVAIDDADHVYVSKYFPAGATTCPDGSPSPAETRIEQFAADGSFAGTSAPCYGIPSGVPFGSGPKLSVDPVSGEPYLAYYNNTSGVPGFPGAAFAFIFGDLGAAPDLALEPPSEISPTGVTISGEINPHGPLGAAGHPNPTNTAYQVQYQVEGDPGWTTYAPPTSVGFGTSPVPFSVGVSGLTPKTTYNFRLIVTKRGRQVVIGPVQTATTGPAPPAIDDVHSSNITAGSVDLHARINPRGTDTTYYFEYGTTLQYGHQTPPTDIGNSQFPVVRVDHVDGLEPRVYHFRVVATNALGTTRSDDQTFNFYPEPCPNLAVRQQTGAARLPDCRAYELVSPADAGGTSLFSSGPSSPSATSPSRFSFFGILGSIPGAGNPPNVLGDLYVSTRTSTGWETHYVGIPGDQQWQVGGPPNLGIHVESPPANLPMADLRLDRFLDWEAGQQGTSCCGFWGSMAPYMWDASGNSLGRLPTNLAGVPGGGDDLHHGGFVGAVRPSPDFSHYFFSSANVAFASGGLTSGNGSVYDDDLETGAVTIVSKLPGGGDIPPEPGDQTDDYFTLPAASTDGSHILIAAAGTGLCGKASCSPQICGGPVCDPIAQVCGQGNTNIGRCPAGLPVHLYMRVGGAITYDVSQAHLVKYQGMTADGSKVYFTSAQKLTSDDHDTSTDLYMWSEATDSLTRVSVGSSGVVGDTDACSPTWTTGCDVEVVPPNVGTQFTNASDNSIAADAGDIYFYSPEQFVGGRGIPGRRNLYVFRGGQVHYVTTLDPDKPLTRIQVSPDGAHAAFLTATQLTGYDNTIPGGVCEPAGYTGPATGPRCQEMYAYNVDQDTLTCVSCLAIGTPPAGDVQASQNGIFMSNDGRTFFATRDAVVPEDSNGITDVYEYAGGHPQLISSGTGDTEKSLLGQAGLVGVSGDGVDVYFATFSKLVAGDRNGKYLRFYDARANGGFPVAAEVAPCQAADECHGVGSASPPAPTIASTAALGGGGNLHQRRAKKHRHKKHHRRHKHHQAGTGRGGGK